MSRGVDGWRWIDSWMINDGGVNRWLMDGWLDNGGCIHRKMNEIIIDSVPTVGKAPFLSITFLKANKYSVG